MTVTARPVTIIYRDTTTQAVTTAVDERAMSVGVYVAAVTIPAPAGTYRWVETITQQGAGPEANTRSETGTVTLASAGNITIPAFSYRGVRSIGNAHQVAVNIDVDDGNTIPFATSRDQVPWTFNPAPAPRAACRLTCNWNVVPYIKGTGFDMVPQTIWEPQLDAIKAAGFDTLRTQLLFPFWLQPATQHTWDTVAAAKVDAFHDYAYSIGLDIYQGIGNGLTVWGGDATYGTGSYTFGGVTYSGLYTMMTQSAVNGWVADIAARWPHFKLFQSGNEPTGGAGLGNPTIAAQVVTSVKRSRVALNAAIPDHKFGVPVGVPMSFLDLCYQAGLVGSDYDWIDQHPYGLLFQSGQLAQISHARVTQQASDTGNGEIVGVTEACIDLAATYGQPAPQLALSEVGYSTSFDDRFGPGIHCTEQMQADLDCYDLDQASRHPNVALVGLYGWWDPWGLTRAVDFSTGTYSDFSDCYGLLRADGTPKAGLATVTAKLAAIHAAAI